MFSSVVSPGRRARFATVTAGSCLSSGRRGRIVKQACISLVHRSVTVKHHLHHGDVGGVSLSLGCPLLGVRKFTS